MSFQFYVSVKGQKQGQLKGESTKSKGSDKWIEVASVEMHSGTPVDQAHGGPTGQRTHKPLVITRETDSASPQLLNAHWNNEVLTEVVVEKEFHGHITQRITLTNATISGLGRAFRPHGLGPESTSHDTDTLEQYSFIFSKIQVENVAGSTSTSDDWTANNS
jgi:type VI secretion system secreted protein Hcp